MSLQKETAQQRWRVVSPFGLHWLVEGDEAVVYFDGSGDTHLVGGFASEVLRRIEEGPVSAGELVAEAVAANGESEMRVRPAIIETLREFRRLGLIEAARAD